MVYKPEYVKGEILVSFKKSCNSERFARKFGETIGYQSSKESYEHGNLYIFKTKVGKEREAIKRFVAHSKFVDWANLRDLKYESRLSSKEELESMVQNLDPSNLPDEEYKNQLEEIRKYIKKLISS